MLVDPGIWTADTKLCLSKHHNQMSLAMSLQAGLVLPLLFIHATVVLIPDLSCICELNFSLHNDCKANKTAFSSRQLIWSEVSSAVHIPPVAVPRHSAPPPYLWSIWFYNNIWLTPLNRGRKFIHIIGPPQVLPNRVGHSHGSIKITTVSERAAFLAISILL